MATPPPNFDDNIGGPSTTAKLQPGEPVRGTFSFYSFNSADSDWFRVELTAGATYVFSFTGVDIAQFQDVQLGLRDLDGKELTSVRGSTMQAPAFEYTPTASGTFFLEARSWFSFMGHSGSAYEVAFSLKGGDDYTADATTTGQLALGVEEQALHNNRGDADWFSYAFEAGKTYALAPSLANTHEVSLMVVDASGKVLAPAGTPFTPDIAGTYFVAASSTAAGAYAFTLSQPVDDYAATVATAGRLQLGGQLKGALDYIGDSDWIKVNLDAGIFYTFGLKGLAVKDLARLTFMTAQGVPLPVTMAIDSSGEAAVTFKVDTPGEYFANISYGPATGFHVRDYVLNWSPVATVDDAGNMPETARTASVGEAITAQLTGTTDVDVFNYTLKQGVTYVWKTSGSDVANMRATLRGANGEYLQSGHQDGLFYTPQADGQYLLFLSNPGIPFGSTIRNYTLTALPQPLDDYAANAEGAGMALPGKAFRGQLSAGGGDRDWIGMQLQAGQSYWFNLVNGSAEEYPGIVHAQVLDAAGRELKATNSINSFYMPVLQFTPTTSGTYYFSVAGNSTYAGSYELTTTLTNLDDHGNSPADGTPLADGEVRTGILEQRTDQDFFVLPDLIEGRQVFTFERSDGQAIAPIFLGWNHFPVSLVNSVTVGGTTYFHFGGERPDSVYVAGNDNVPVKYTVKYYSVPDDYNSGGGPAAAVRVDSHITGAIEVPGDVDAFRVELVGGQRYLIDLYGVAGGGGTLDASAPMVVLRNPDGSLARMSVVEGEARILVDVEVSGAYQVDVGGAAATGSYRLAVQKLSGDKVAPTIAVPVPPLVNAVDHLYLPFSEQVQLGSGAVVLKDSAGNAIPAAVTVLHHVVTIDPLAALKAGQAYTLELSSAGIQDFSGNAYTGPRSIAFTAQDSSAQAGSGNDTIVSLGTGTAVDGGAGIDTLVMSGPRNAYHIHPLADGRFQVQPVTGQASEVLSNFERVHFADGAVALDIGGTGGQAYRMYRAAFDRAPDLVGAGYWTGRMDSGMSLKEVAQAFISSAEFTARYGAQPTNAEFINLLYQNVLHRAGDANGIAYWNQMLDGGYSRADTLIGFAESPENKVSVANLIGAGFAYIPI